ncbi:PAS domain S-box protein [Pedobacter metabolipauper]|uniref:histidine kinase n=1 Tax=Pedobacter metabolipauper TaxID=425513 RepID=A0A4V3D129_9SPHI|nr:PAS domain S-box protein [Pedobacter metabolipauper]TDQ08804.1 PAS domain S-box-containing protein [Pedobacter metabolipauper]
MNKLRILHLEDVHSDAELVSRFLRKSKLDFVGLVVDNRENFIKGLSEFMPDVVLSDHSLPSFNSYEALSIFQKTGLKIPFILITATISEEFAVDIIKRGADDYILKDRLERLPTALQNALDKFGLIKDHQKNLEELIRNETLFRALIENSHDAITLFNENGEWVYQSPSVERLTGFSFIELAGKKVSTYIHADDQLNYVAVLDRLRMFPDVPVPFRFRFLHKQGHFISAEGTITNLLKDESINAFIMNYSDNTERIQAENERRSLEELLDKANNLARIGSYELDLVNNTLYWSAVTKEIHEVENDYQPDLQTAVDFYKEGLNRKAIMQNMSEAISDGITVDLELEIVTAKGNDRWIRIIGEAEFLHGKCIKLGGSFQDIDVRKRAEIEALKAAQEKNLILESIKDGFYALDHDWIITYWNKEAEHILGKKREDVIGKNLWDIYQDAIGTISYIKLYQSARENNMQHYERFNNELNIWLEISIYPSPNGLSVFFKDITERKLADLERIKMMDDILHRNRDLEQFSYIVSHNLRAPVANIIGLTAELSEHAAVSDEVKDLNKFLSASVNQLDNVIRDLNHVLQVKGQIGEKKEKVVLSKIINEILFSIKDLVDLENVEIRMDFSAGDELSTLKSYLYSIFYNLIANSIKYRQPGTLPVIEIKSETTEDSLLITFKDNGIGIDLEKYSEQVFGLYKRFHQHVEGKGMGLFMVKTQVEALGGFITINSSVDQGTEFTLEFLNTLNEF